MRRQICSPCRAWEQICDSAQCLRISLTRCNHMFLKAKMCALNEHDHRKQFLSFQPFKHFSLHNFIDPFSTFYRHLLRGSASLKTPQSHRHNTCISSEQLGKSGKERKTRDVYLQYSCWGITTVPMHIVLCDQPWLVAAGQAASSLFHAVLHVKITRLWLHK